MLNKSGMGGYDRSLTMFSPEGRLFQVEYALESVKKGTLAIGIKGSSGAILAIHKKLSSKLMDPESIHKIYQVDEHIGCAISGLHADSRILVDYARVQCQVNKLTYNENVRLRTLVRKLADIIQQYTQYGGVRPFGSALMFIAVDADGPQLMTTSPTGRYWNWKAHAIGINENQAKTILKENYDKDASLDDMKKLALKVLKKTSEDELDPELLQIAYVDAKDKQFIIEKMEDTKALYESLE
ncbi:MAG: archaeal proteasome endopeptidase complex subunit alpha [Candidatus Lokiarchaeota archaeon]|nr:archaeal proteasome endopeptidase complex subunit alpha [Candidatus Lokiarchaeota archaeon]